MLGEVLRTERERRQLTIHDIEEATSIRALYIEAIENGDYEKLPGDVYSKGFIKNYATFLNLDGESLVKEFIAERQPIVTEENVEDNEQNLNKKIETPESPPPTDIKIRRSERQGGSGGSSFGLVAAIILIAAVAGGAWYYLTNSDAQIVDNDPKQPIEQPLTNPENQTNPQNPEGQLPNSASAAPNQSGVNIQAKFTGDCWTQVIADGNLVYEDVAIAGQALNWTGKNSIIVRVGNAGVVEVTENGRSIGQLGEIGEVVEKTFGRT